MSGCACGGSCGCGHHDEQENTETMSREEYLARLQQYLSDLKAEIRAVEGEIASLQLAV